MMGWVKMPEGADTWAALDAAVEAGVKYNPGGIYRAPRDRNNHLRLTFSHNTRRRYARAWRHWRMCLSARGLFG